MRKVVEMFVVALATAGLLQLGLYFGPITTALVYGLVIYVLIGSWFVFRHRGEPKPEHLLQHIWKALNWPNYWSKP